MKTKSKVNASFQITPDCWVVSVLNVNNQWFGLPGHSIIVVEGIGLNSQDQQLKKNGQIEDCDSIS